MGQLILNQGLTRTKGNSEREKLSSVTLASHFESLRGLFFGEGSRDFEPWSNDETDTCNGTSLFKLPHHACWILNDMFTSSDIHAPGPDKQPIFSGIGFRTKNSKSEVLTTKHHFSWRETLPILTFDLHNTTAERR
ncbi:hypothetical protein AVEN_94595-1 [Araneus ventricosus]|uniref:Uncharacterized protein n=1 Tax=Araneus ventricosus TaxID=182803 RepID=A0A4Y2INF2_ARAVE|nr:hypothetical protein AVEN_94595-1 [Araneus ventricosus]